MKFRSDVAHQRLRHLGSVGDHQPVADPGQRVVLGIAVAVGAGQRRHRGPPLLGLGSATLGDDVPAAPGRAHADYPLLVLGPVSLDLVGERLLVQQPLRPDRVQPLDRIPVAGLQGGGLHHVVADEHRPHERAGGAERMKPGADAGDAVGPAHRERDLVRHAVAVGVAVAERTQQLDEAVEVFRHRFAERFQPLRAHERAVRHLSAAAQKPDARDVVHVAVERGMQAACGGDLVERLGDVGGVACDVILQGDVQPLLAVVVAHRLADADERVGQVVGGVHQGHLGLGVLARQVDPVEHEVGLLGPVPHHLLVVEVGRVPVVDHRHPEGHRLVQNRQSRGVEIVADGNLARSRLAFSAGRGGDRNDEHQQCSQCHCRGCLVHELLLEASGPVSHCTASRQVRKPCPADEPNAPAFGGSGATECPLRTSPSMSRSSRRARSGAG